jgi:c-di-AMP phosphodiesterase-like protein
MNLRQGAGLYFQMHLVFYLETVFSLFCAIWSLTKINLFISTIFLIFYTFVRNYKTMQNILHKILSLVLCVAYMFASCGFAGHVCKNNDKDITYVSLFVNNECNYCLENKNTEEQCCHQLVQQTQHEDGDCCEKTLKKISDDQNYSQCGILESIFLTVSSVIFPSKPDLICADLSLSATSFTPLIKSKTPLIYFTGQLRL